METVSVIVGDVLRGACLASYGQQYWRLTAKLDSADIRQPYLAAAVNKQLDV